MATDLPTRADVLRRAADLLMPFPGDLPEPHNARTNRGIALLQLHDRLPADPPAAVPVVGPAFIIKDTPGGGHGPTEDVSIQWDGHLFRLADGQSLHVDDDGTVSLSPATPKEG